MQYHAKLENPDADELRESSVVVLLKVMRMVMPLLDVRARRRVFVFAHTKLLLPHFRGAAPSALRPVCRVAADAVPVRICESRAQSAANFSRSSTGTRRARGLSIGWKRLGTGCRDDDDDVER